MKTSKLELIDQRVRFLAHLLVSPKFYEIISEPLKNMSQLDSSLGTLCYASLFVGAVITKFPQFRDLVDVLQPKILKLVKSVILKLVERILLGLKLGVVNSSKLIKGNDKIKGLALTFEDVINKALHKVGQWDNLNEKGSPVAVPKSEMTATEAHVSKTLTSFSRYISDVRMFYRGFQIPDSIIGLLTAPGEMLPKGAYIDLISTISICLYQPFETVAFLLDKAWLLPSPDGPNKCLWWYLTSTKMWFLWVLVEFVHSIIDTYKDLRGDIKSRGKRPNIHLLLRAMGNLDHKKWIVLLEHLATIPLCVHWSLPDGCLSNMQVGLFGTLAGGLSTSLIWSEVLDKISKL